MQEYLDGFTNFIFQPKNLASGLVSNLFLLMGYFIGVYCERERWKNKV